MVAARAGFDVPLLISVWGNDFTLHAPASPGMRRYTRRALEGTDGLHTDSQRDIHLAENWGFNPSKPTIVLPGGGGIDRELFRPGLPSLDGVKSEIADALATLPSETPLVVNPRGFRSYVRTDTYFQSIPIVLEVIPEASFFCVGMAGEPEAERWVQRLGIESNVRLLPYLTKPEMAEIFRRAVVSVSPSEHDGTPNTFLEAIACGVFPIAGDIESLREWVTPGENGFLVDPGDPQDLASATIAAILDGDLRASASKLNQQIIDERAEREIVGERARRFYQQLLSQDR
jgi:glycosyltransferase involved in cell wall biosynthesis